MPSSGVFETDFGVFYPSTDFGNLVISYGGSAEIPYYHSGTNPTGAAMYNNLGPDSIPNFQLAGGYWFGQF